MDFEWHYCSETRCSTQDLAKDWMRSGRDLGREQACPAGIFYTFSQQKGRGQAGNAWFCGQGRNVAMTVAFRPERLEASDLFVLDMALSLGLLRYARRINAHCCLKWPNDLYFGRRKLAGMLIETRVAGSRVEEVYLGIGMNLNQESFPADLPNPVSFRQLDGRERDLQKESRLLVSDIGKAYSVFMDQYAMAEERGENLFELYKEEYLNSLLFYGQWRDFVFNGREIRARIDDVDEFGRLGLRDRRNGIRFADIKELRYCLP